MKATLKTLLPELNNLQLSMLHRLIEEVIGEKVDIWALVQKGERQKAKDASAVNCEKDKQHIRLRKLMGVEEPPQKDNRWHIY